MMSLVKATPEGLKDCKCKRITLPKCSPIPYVPKKDFVHETVFSLKAESLKTQIGAGTALRVCIWHSGTGEEAFLMHVGSTMDINKDT
jgi:hypothetical protein